MIEEDFEGEEVSRPVEESCGLEVDADLVFCVRCITQLQAQTKPVAIYRKEDGFEADTEKQVEDIMDPSNYLVIHTVNLDENMIEMVECEVLWGAP